MWDELEDKIEVFKSADRTNLKHLLTSYKVIQGPDMRGVHGPGDLPGITKGSQGILGLEPDPVFLKVRSWIRFHLQGLT